MDPSHYKRIACKIQGYLSEESIASWIERKKAAERTGSTLQPSDRVVQGYAEAEFRLASL